MFPLQPSRAFAQTFPNVTWSNQEITIPGNGNKHLVVTTTSSSFAPGWHTYIVTFSTELATSEGFQLAILGYSLGSNPTVPLGVICGNGTPRTEYGLREG